MGAELAFVVLQGAVKFLDGLFWVFGKGVLSILAYVVASVARALLAAMDAPPPRGGPSSGGGGPSSPNDAKIGAPRAAPLDPDLIPVSPRVRLSSRGDAKKMRDKHAAHCAWRHKYDVANILQTPKPVFDVVKAYYPHAFHGRTKGRHAVQLERPGRFGDLLAAVRRIPGHADDPADAVAAHVSFVLTHAFDKIDPRPLPNGRVLRVVDMSRLDASDTSFEAFAFLRVMAGVSSAAFPERVHRVVIVNPPSVFGLMWSAFSPLISKGTLARIRICKTPEETFEALEEDLDASDIPREFGGTCECAAPRGYARRARARGALGMDGGDDTPLDRCGPCWKYDEHERRLRARVDELNGRVPRRGGRGARGRRRRAGRRRTTPPGRAKTRTRARRGAGGNDDAGGGEAATGPGPGTTRRFEGRGAGRSWTWTARGGRGDGARARRGGGGRDAVRRGRRPSGEDRAEGPRRNTDGSASS